MLEWTYRIGLGLIVVMGLMAFATTIRAPNGYGRYLGSKLEGTIAARPGWLIFEAPQWMAFALTFWLTARASNINPATLLLFGLWQAHYLYRGLAMPFLMQIGRKRLPIATIWFGLPFNALNGFVNGYAVGHAEHLASASWLSDPRFVAGLAIAGLGWAINVHSDNLLFRLRKPGETGYRVPYGGMFRFVSSANYLGEIMLWIGWGVMTWTAAGLIFALFTIANLGPRALSHHKWYRATFADYPPERRALIPFVL